MVRGAAASTYMLAFAGFMTWRLVRWILARIPRGVRSMKAVALRGET